MQLVNIKTQKQTHRYKEQTSGYQWGEEGAKGQYIGVEIKSYKLLGKK